MADRLRRPRGDQTASKDEAQAVMAAGHSQGMRHFRNDAAQQDDVEHQQGGQRAAQNIGPRGEEHRRPGGPGVEDQPGHPLRLHQRQVKRQDGAKGGAENDRGTVAMVVQGGRQGLHGLLQRGVVGVGAAGGSLRFPGQGGDEDAMAPRKGPGQGFQPVTVAVGPRNHQ